MLKRALSAATTMSQAIVRLIAAPEAKPCTRAITGLGLRRISKMPE
jgi:hypothetical protein